MHRSAQIIILFLLLLTACSKHNSDISPAADKNSVTINGKVYKTVTIGMQIWTAENYSGPGGYTDAVVSQFGSYYTRTQALAIALPSGWRLPTFADYNKLTSNITTDIDTDGNYLSFTDNAAVALTSTTGWRSLQGTNSLGFNGMNSGYFIVRSAQATFADVQNGLYVTAEAIPVTTTQHAQYGYQLSPSLAAIIQYPDPDAGSFSVRFVKDK